MRHFFTISLVVASSHASIVNRVAYLDHRPEVFGAKVFSDNDSDGVIVGDPEVGSGRIARSKNRRYPSDNDPIDYDNRYSFAGPSDEQGGYMSGAGGDARGGARGDAQDDARGDGQGGDAQGGSRGDGPPYDGPPFGADPSDREPVPRYGLDDPLDHDIPVVHRDTPDEMPRMEPKRSWMSSLLDELSHLGGHLSSTKPARHGKAHPANPNRNPHPDPEPAELAPSEYRHDEDELPHADPALQRDYEAIRDVVQKHTENEDAIPRWEELPDKLKEKLIRMQRLHELDEAGHLEGLANAVDISGMDGYQKLRSGDTEEPAPVRRQSRPRTRRGHGHHPSYSTTTIHLDDMGHRS